MNNIETYTQTVDEDKIGSRLDRFLADTWPAISRSRIKSLLLDQAVQLNGQIILNPSYRVKAGDAIEMVIPAAEELDVQPQKMDLNIVYEDEHLIVIDKAAGLVVHPAPGNYDNTLVNGLMYHCGDSLSGIGGVKRPGIVHRIDKDTSGLIVIAKSDAAHAGLSALFEAHNIDRLYTAIVWGTPNPPDGTIEGNIGRHPKQRKKMTVVGPNTGKHAITHYTTIKRMALAASIIECKLETGRTHQIRVHLTSMGHPLVGDQTYGGPTRNKLSRLSKEVQNYTRNFPRQALHAKILGFKHPITGDDLNFESDMPDDMKELVRQFQNPS